MGQLRRVVWVALLAAAWPGEFARADTVDDKDGLFTHVTILELDDEQLVFVFNDGRTLQRAADAIRSIVLSEGNDPAAEDLTKAELLRTQGKRREALDLYKQAAKTCQKAWVRDFAVMRIVGICDELGELWIAYRAYLSLAETHPRLCERIVPKRIPRKDSKVCRDILADIDGAMEARQSDNVTGAMTHFRNAILRLKPSEPVAAVPGPQPTADSPPAASVRPPVESAISPRLATVRDSLTHGDLAVAARGLDECRALATPGDEPALLLIEAELALARGEVRQAGLAAMRIVASHPNSPQTADALFVAGQTQEKLGRTEKALELYRRSAADARASDELKARVGQRIGALTSAPGAAASAPAGASP